MFIYLKSKSGAYDAKAEYDFLNKTVTVLEGSRVSSDVAHSEKFRGARSIEKKRQDTVTSDYIVNQNVLFSSPSTAGNFVTGRSTNGHIAWRDENGKTLKELFGRK